MPSEAIERVKINVAELSSAGRSIGIVTLRRTRSGDAPVLLEEAREVAALAPHDDPPQHDPERGEQEREQGEPAEDPAAREIRARHEDRDARARDDGEHGRERGVFERMERGAPERRIVQQRSVRVQRQHAACLVERPVADRGVQKRNERAEDEHDHDDPDEPLQRPRRQHAAAGARDGRRCSGHSG
jgi:hypothetical protein